jgi:very-short-patch-repair endonuclease
MNPWWVKPDPAPTLPITKGIATSVGCFRTSIFDRAYRGSRDNAPYLRDDRGNMFAPSSCTSDGHFTPNHTLSTFPLYVDLDPLEPYESKDLVTPQTPSTPSTHYECDPESPQRSPYESEPKREDRANGVPPPFSLHNVGYLRAACLPSVTLDIHSTVVEKEVEPSLDWWVSLLDILRVMRTCSLHHMDKIRRRIVGADIVPLQLASSHWTWTRDQGWERLDSTSSTWYLPYTELSTLVGWVIKHSRMSTHRQQWICDTLGMGSSPSGQIQLCLEEHLVSMLEQVCPYTIQKQYRLERYRLDVYLPDVKLAVEIDERGHQHYDATQEREKEHCIASHGIRLLRLNPHQGSIHPNNPHLTETQLNHVGLTLIRMVWEATHRTAPSHGAT